MNTYEGIPMRVGMGGYLVLKNGETLMPDKSQAIVNHSPDGFMWGYQGSGPAQLALALLMEEGYDPAYQIPPYQDFKRHVIANLPLDARWEMTSEDIAVYMRNQSRE